MKIPSKKRYKAFDNLLFIIVILGFFISWFCDKQQLIQRDVYNFANACLVFILFFPYFIFNILYREAQGVVVITQEKYPNQFIFLSGMNLVISVVSFGCMIYFLLRLLKQV